MVELAAIAVLVVVTPLLKMTFWSAVAVEPPLPGVNWPFSNGALALLDPNPGVPLLSAIVTLNEASLPLPTKFALTLVPSPAG